MTEKTAKENPVEPTPPPNSKQAETSWKDDIDARFQPGRKISLPRPIRNFFLCEREKLVYAPIAKCACTSLKRMMVELAQLPHGDKILEHGVHRVTDYAQTGMQMKDLELASVRQILNGSDYYKFTVIRDPISRVISAYTEKFVKNRVTAANKFHTAPALRAVRGLDNPDFEQGISFREFVHYLLRSNPHDLDVHWGFQIHYLGGVNRYDRVFTMGQIDTLALTLAQMTGREITLGQHNTSVNRHTLDTATPTGRYVDCMPTELDNLHDISARDFMDAELVASLKHYYARDLELFQDAEAGLHDYQPDPVAVDIVRAIVEPPEIARRIMLYCKGFLAVDKLGVGKLQVLIQNKGNEDIDFDTLTRCSLAYETRNMSGQIVATTQRVAVEPGLLAGQATISKTIPIELPVAVLGSADHVEISMQLGESCRVLDFSPLHIATAQIMPLPV